MLGRRLRRFEQFKFGFPVAQNVGLDTDYFANLADFEVNLLWQTSTHRYDSYSDAFEVGDAMDDVDAMLFKFFFMI